MSGPEGFTGSRLVPGSPELLLLRGERGGGNQLPPLIGTETLTSICQILQLSLHSFARRDPLAAFGKRGFSTHEGCTSGSGDTPRNHEFLSQRKVLIRKTISLSRGEQMRRPDRGPGSSCGCPITTGTRPMRAPDSCGDPRIFECQGKETLAQ